MAFESPKIVFGFDSPLDWRPTVFINGVPAHRVCSACGLVPSTIAVLSCGHFLCQPCLDHCVASVSRCFLDGRHFQRDDVDWTPFATESLLSLEIRCWNSTVGCDATGSASEIAHHFRNGCTYHTVSCLRCGERISHKDIVSHLESGLCKNNDEAQIQSDGDVELGRGQISSALVELTKKVSFLQTTLQENFKLMGDSLERAIQQGRPHSPARCADHCSNNRPREVTPLRRRNAFVATEESRTVSQKFATLIQEVKKAVIDSEASLMRFLEEKSGEARTACSSIKQGIDTLISASLIERKNAEKESSLTENLKEDRTKLETTSQEDRVKSQMAQSHKPRFHEISRESTLDNRLNVSKVLDWTVDSWSDLKQKNRRGAEARLFAEKPDYFYGYYISPGIELVTKSSVPYLRLVFHICQGDYDQHVAWPLNKKLCLRLLHPTQYERVLDVFVDTAGSDPSPYQMPRFPRSVLLCSSENVAVDVLENNGYIKDDKLKVQFKLIP